MQLLPQTKVTEQKKDEREAEVFRRLRVQKAKVEGEREIHEIASNLDPEKKKILKEFDDFKDGIEKRKSKLLGEILVLERRRDTAMEPFYELKFQALEAMDRAKAWEDKVKSAARKINETRVAVTNLQVKLDEKEKFLANKEQVIGNAEIVAIEREAALVSAEKDLETRKANFEELTARVAAEQETKDRDLKAREASVEAKLDSVEKRENDLEDEKKHLESQRQTLALAFEEARKKGVL